MCANDGPPRAGPAADDVWADSDDDGPELTPAARSSAQRSQLDREWETRKQQYYNVRTMHHADAPVVLCVAALSSMPTLHCMAACLYSLSTLPGWLQGRHRCRKGGHATAGLQCR